MANFERDEQYHEGDSKRLWHRKRKGQYLTAEQEEYLERQEEVNNRVKGYLTGSYNPDIHFGSNDHHNAK